MNHRNFIKLFDYWQKSSEQDWQVAQKLFKLKHYNYCLFFCHLTLEKLIKALIVSKTKKQAPFIHDLYSLILKIGVVVNQEQKENLEIINTFNMRARYDSVKFEFYKKANRSYAERYLKICQDLILWLKKELIKK